MLILPPGHGQAVLVQRRFRTREKWILGAVLGSVAVLIGVVVISISTAGHVSSNGCIDVTVPYSIGGQEFYHCGSAARAICKLVDSPNGFSGTPARAVATECRKAHLPVGS